MKPYVPEEFWANRDFFFYEGMQLEVGPFFRDFSASYKGSAYTIPLDGDFHMVYYRSDLLEAAGMDDCFEVRVDGLDQAEMGFPGKPAPDVFLEAARRLGVEPAHAAVVEDAISGVRAGRDGDFGLVVGLGLVGQLAAQFLKAAGARVGSLSSRAACSRARAAASMASMILV